MERNSPHTPRLPYQSESWGVRTASEVLPRTPARGVSSRWDTDGAVCVSVPTYSADHYESVGLTTVCGGRGAIHDLHAPDYRN